MKFAVCIGKKSALHQWKDDSLKLVSAVVKYFKYLNYTLYVNQPWTKAGLVNNQMEKKKKNISGSLHTASSCSKIYLSNFQIVVTAFKDCGEIILASSFGIKTRVESNSAHNCQ